MSGGGRKVQTVLGEVPSKDLGVTLSHEHLLVDFSGALATSPTLRDGRSLRDMDLTMENMGLIRRFPYSVHENLSLDDVELAKEELQVYRQCGGGTVCEMSVIGMRRSNHTPQDLVKIARATSLNIVSATGFYWSKLLPEWVWPLDVRQLADVLVEEACQGVGGVKCGVMYLACSYPPSAIEKKTLQAVVMAHKETGLSLAVNCDKSPEAPPHTLDYLCELGMPESAVSLVHVGATYTSSEEHMAILRQLCHRGCYINHSFFGKECAHNQFNFVAMPNDGERIQRLKALVASGCEDRLLVSHDVVCKTDLSHYGGHGYGHLLEHIVPKMKDRGIKDDIINKLIRDNPQNWLSHST